MTTASLKPSLLDKLGLPDRFTVQVTQADIEASDSFGRVVNPVNVAAHRAVPGLRMRVSGYWMFATLDLSRLGNPDEIAKMEYALPWRARWWLRRFRAGKPVKPLTFEATL